MTAPAHEGRPWATVRVTPDGDGLVIGPPDAVAAPIHLRVTIEVSGGRLLVDMTRPDDPPIAEIDDPFWALTWLAGLYGPEAAERAKEVARGDAGDGEVLATQGYLRDPVIRLGVALWLHRWWPSGSPDLPAHFPVDLLEIEIGALRWHAEAAFIETSGIERALAPHASTLPDRVRLVRERGQGETGRLLGETLTSALRAVVAVLSEDTEGYDACRELLEQIVDEDQQVAAGRLLLDAELLLLLGGPALVAPTRTGAVPRPDLLVATPWRERRRGQATTNPSDLPSRQVREVPLNVTWFVETAGPDTRIRIRVQAAPELVTAPGGRPLEADLEIAERDSVPVVLAWGLDPVTGEVFFEGTLAVDDLAREETVPVHVWVHHPEWAVAESDPEDADVVRRGVARVLHERLERTRTGVRPDDDHPRPGLRPTAAETAAVADEGS